MSLTSITWGRADFLPVLQAALQIHSAQPSSLHRDWNVLSKQTLPFTDINSRSFKLLFPTKHCLPSTTYAGRTLTLAPVSWEKPERITNPWERCPSPYSAKCEQQSGSIHSSKWARTKTETHLKIPNSLRLMSQCLECKTGFRSEFTSFIVTVMRQTSASTLSQRPELSTELGSSGTARMLQADLNPLCHEEQKKFRNARWHSAVTCSLRLLLSRAEKFTRVIQN